MAETTVLIPVSDEPEVLEWLEGFGLRPRARALRYPTLGELRAAARSSRPTELDEHFSHGRWYVELAYEDGGFELKADVARLDDAAIVTSVGFRGGDEKIDAVAEAIAAAIGPVITVGSSAGTPRLHGDHARS